MCILVIDTGGSDGDNRGHSGMERAVSARSAVHLRDSVWHICHLTGHSETPRL